MIYVTGDLHGDLDRLKKLPVRLKKQDTLIVLGDFGFLWDASASEQKKLRWLGRRPYQLLFLDGAHENFDLLDKLPAEPFAGGMAQTVSGRLRRLLRGEVYTLENKRILCFGGGASEDAEERTPGESWWPQEMPSEEEYHRCLENLAACHNQVDVILTHDAPEKMLQLLRLNEPGQVQPNDLETFLQEISVTTSWSRWFFGRFHRDQPLGPRTTAVWRKVLPLYEAQPKRRWPFGKKSKEL